MSPFQPIGAQARWRTIYELLRPVPIDAAISYEELGVALALDPDADRHKIQTAVRRAARELLEVDLRAVEPLANKGYRVVRSDEHLRLAQAHQRRAKRQLVAGHSKVIHVDMNELEPSVRGAFQIVAQAFSMQMEFNRRLDVRQRRLEDAVQAIERRSNRSESEVTELRERLARLEAARQQ